MTEHAPREVLDVLEDVDPGELPKVSFERLSSDWYTCVDPDRGIYVDKDGDLYRSTYRHTVDDTDGGA